MRQEPLNSIDRTGPAFVDVWPREEGWCGKNFACAQLAKAAAGKYLLFIDADARLMEGAVGRMVEEMNRRLRLELPCE